MNDHAQPAGTSSVPASFRKPCFRCLIRDLPYGAALSASLQELIGMIPPEDRASPALVSRRLSACRQCDHLAQGTCGLCGCYVEHRAEKRSSTCPALPSRWA